MKQMMKIGLSTMLALMLTVGNGVALVEGVEQNAYESSVKAHDFTLESPAGTLDPAKKEPTEGASPASEPPAEMPAPDSAGQIESETGDAGQSADGESPSKDNAPDETAALDQPNIGRDMKQFVPGARYGLLALNGKKKPVALDGRTFTIGEAYQLRARYKVTGRVEPGVEYVYKLPPVLVSGVYGAQEKTIFLNKKAFGTCSLNGDELRVVFTKKAANYLEKAKNSFVFNYDFKEMLNEPLTDGATTATVSLPRKKGSATASIKIKRAKSIAEQPAEAQSADLPAAEPLSEEQLLEEQSPIENFEDALLLEDPPIEDQSAEELPVAERSVSVKRVMPDIVRDGDPFRVEATLVGFNEIGYELQWQYNDGSGWQDALGANGPTVELIADRDNVNYAWRVFVTIV